jgi:hypothetical protein
MTLLKLWRQLGLERGIKGSKAKHTEISKYYAAVNSAPDGNLDISSMQQLVADRQRAIKSSAQMEQTAKALALELQRQEKRLLELEGIAKEQAQQAQLWQKKYQELANKVRDIPLEKVAYELGLDPDPLDKHKWQHEDHIINITGSKFYDWQHLKGGGGAIDLVMHVNGCNFKQAVAWLNDRLGESVTLEAATYKTREIIQTEQPRPFIAPTPDADKWQQEDLPHPRTPTT